MTHPSIKGEWPSAIAERLHRLAATKAMAVELYRDDHSISRICRRLGLKPEAVEAAIIEAGVPLRPTPWSPPRLTMQQDRTWCAQCDTLRHQAEIDACGSQWCVKARAA